MYFIPETTPFPTSKTKEEFLEDDEASGMAPKADEEEGSSGSVDSKEGLASPDYVKPDQLDETGREEEEELNIIEESGEKEIMKGNFILFYLFLFSNHLLRCCCSEAIQNTPRAILTLY